jgi:tRNA (Thr-GGU) A37 N-methylase
MHETSYSLYPIGFLHSPLKDRGAAPRQGREGAPDAWLEVDAAVAEGLEGMCAIEARHCLLRVRNTTGVEVVKAAPDLHPERVGGTIAWCEEGRTG